MESSKMCRCSFLIHLESLRNKPFILNIEHSNVRVMYFWGSKVPTNIFRCQLNLIVLTQTEWSVCLSSQTSPHSLGLVLVTFPEPVQSFQLLQQCFPCQAVPQNHIRNHLKYYFKNIYIYFQLQIYNKKDIFILLDIL